MKVLQVFRPVDGGIKRHLQTLAYRLPNYNFRPVLCGPKMSAKKGELPCDYKLAISDGFAIYDDLKNIFHLKEIITSVKPDIVHTHGYKAMLITSEALRMSSVPWVCTVHNFRTWGQESFIKKIWYHFIAKKIFYQVNKILCVSSSLQKEIINLGIPKEKTLVLYNGIPLKPYHQPLKDQVNLFHLNKQTIVCIARLAPDKGVGNFLKAVKYLVSRYNSLIDWLGVEFLIVGDGPYRTYYEKMAWQLKIAPYVKFTGYRQDIPDILKNAKILCIPSKQEGLSIAAMEAMVSMCPVIATATGGLTELISHRKTGLLVKKDNPKDLSYKIIELIRSKALQRKLIFNAYRKAIDSFSDEYMLDKTVRIYHEVAGNGYFEKH